MGGHASVEVLRGNWVESTHTLDVAMADAAGAIVDQAGDPERLVYPRSSIKALQALALVETGAADAVRLAPRHLALASASHSGAAIHTEAATEMLTAVGLDRDALACGSHPPRDRTERQRLSRLNQEPNPLHNNCSGKHAGMLVLARFLGAPTAGYVEPDHTVQRHIASVLTDVIGAPHASETCAVDGCSVPTYAVPLNALAAGFARFGVGEGFDAQRAKAAERLRQAAFDHPEYVAGEGRPCTIILRALAGRAFVKSGAEGVYGASLPEQGIGIAVKARDGAERAARVAIIHLIAQALSLRLADHADLSELAHAPMVNWAGRTTGSLRFVTA